MLDRGDVQLKELIGWGAAGQVYEGVYLGEEAVAVKQIVLGGYDVKGQLEEARKELVMLQRLSHPHIVRFYGVCFVPAGEGGSGIGMDDATGGMMLDEPNRLWLVMELCAMSVDALAMCGRHCAFFGSCTIGRHGFRPMRAPRLQAHIGPPVSDSSPCTWLQARPFYPPFPTPVPAILG